MSVKLILIRHGQIRANVEGRWHGATDSPLTGAGRRQADRLAKHLAEGEVAETRAIYSSPLRRCRDTAFALSEALNQRVRIDDDLREYSIGELENTRFRTLAEEHNFFRRIQGDPNFAPQGGDSLNAVAARIIRALERIHTHHAAHERVAIVTHGAVMGVALASLLDDDPTGWTNYTVSNCSITELNLSPEPSVDVFNRVEHL